MVAAQKARNLLDYGCGSGHFLTDYAARLTIPLLGYDREADMVASARQNCAPNPNIKIVDTLDQLAPHSFDAIVQGFVWVTWETDAHCVANLQECASLLSRDGRLYTVVSHPFFRDRPFSGFHAKLPEADIMRDGAPFEVTLDVAGKPVATFTDTHWTLSAMFSQIQRAGLQVEGLYEYPDTEPQRYPGAAFLMLVARQQT